MSEKTILFIALNATGHINSLMGIADRMKNDYGYHTVFMLPDLTNVRTIENNGHELIIATSTDLESLRTKEKYTNETYLVRHTSSVFDYLHGDPVDNLVEGFEGEKGILMCVKKELISRNYIYESLINQIKPCLIILDAWFLPPCILKQREIPFVYQISINPLPMTQATRPDGIRPPGFIGSKLLKNREAREKLALEDPESWLSLISSWKEDTERIKNRRVKFDAFEKLYHDNGLECFEIDQPGSHRSPFLNIYLCPKELDYDQETDILTYDPRFFRCDSLIRVPSANDLEEARTWISKIKEKRVGKKGVILFSLGTLASADIHLMNHFLNIFKEDKSHLYVVSSGNKGDSIEDENMIGDRYIPQIAILDYVNLAIVHGGNNTLVECLYHGVPMIVMPFFADQPDNAQRVEDLELGKRLDVINCTKEQLIQAINDVLTDRSIAERVIEISRKIKSRDDTRKLTILLDKLAKEKRLDQSFINYCRDRHPDDIAKCIS